VRARFVQFLLQPGVSGLVGKDGIHTRAVKEGLVVGAVSLTPTPLQKRGAKSPLLWRGFR
jgi:hypothetical protein